MTPSCSTFVAVSVDGFIARLDGSIDWLPVAADGPEEDYGYAEFVAGIDALVMGRGTFDKTLSFEPWPYSANPVFVWSSRPLEMPARLEHASIQRVGGTAREIAATLAARGFARLYIDGGRTIQSFLAAGLLSRLVVTRIPVLLGTGIPLFGPIPGDTRLARVQGRCWPSGLEQTEYRVEAGATPRA